MGCAYENKLRSNFYCYLQVCKYKSESAWLFYFFNLRSFCYYYFILVLKQEIFLYWKCRRFKALPIGIWE